VTGETACPTKKSSWPERKSRSCSTKQAPSRNKDLVVQRAPQKWGSRTPVSRVSILSRSFYTRYGRIVQRLFSGFADGWPGVGLLLLRLLTGLALIHFGIADLREAPPLATVVLQIIGISAGILLLLGLWTPVAGALAAIVKVSIALSRYSSHSGDPWITVVQAVLSAVLAMVGPGAWSIDARLFGRKRIYMPEL
jgi:putative oxidoreductase